MTKHRPTKTKEKAGLHRLIQRRNYLAVAASKRRWITPAFILQALPPTGGEDTTAAPAVGFTASKKVGNAVMRNKARRRLKEVARIAMANEGQTGWQYVVIARQAAIDTDFEKLIADMVWALGKLTAGTDLKSKVTR